MLILDQSLPVKNDTFRVNKEIRISQVRVISATGEQLGVMSPDEARRIASEQGLDLVEVSPETKPPVCKILNYGKFMYERSKKAKPNKQTKLKQIQLGSKIGEHDLATKLNHARAFLADGDRVKFVIKLSGRENANPERFVEILGKMLEPLTAVGKICTQPAIEGRQVTAQVEPL